MSLRLKKILLLLCNLSKTQFPSLKKNIMQINYNTANISASSMVNIFANMMNSKLYKNT